MTGSMAVARACRLDPMCLMTLWSKIDTPLGPRVDYIHEQTPICDHMNKYELRARFTLDRDKRAQRVYSVG